MRDEAGEIEGAADFETGKPRRTPLSYRVAWPDGPARGLVFLIPGFGGDADPAYAASLRSRIARRHGLAAVSVDYHCLRARPETGAQIRIDPRQHVQLLGMAALHGLAVADPKDVEGLCRLLAALPAPARIDAVLAFPGGDLQNFGVVQALDHLRVLGHLTTGGGFDRRRVVALGSSHGGYIAHLMAKIAPRSLAAVIDNSAYVRPPTAYGGGGSQAEYSTRLGGVELRCRTERAWSFDDRDAPDFYGRDPDLIRDMGYPPHLAIQRAAAGDAGTAYRMANATVDEISTPEAKSRQAAALAAAGFDARLSLVGEAELDGRLFRRLVHGLDASLGALADLHLPGVAPRGVDPDTLAGTVIDYPCVDETYRFEHLDRFPHVRGERRPLHGPFAAAARAA